MKWSFAQVGLVVICGFHLIQAVIGFIVEPSFATGPDAPTARCSGWTTTAGTRSPGGSRCSDPA